MSLQDVADRAAMSVATLSRIETDKQSLELGTFLNLTKILDVDASRMIGSAVSDADESQAAPAVDPLLDRIAALPVADRIELWKELRVRSRSAKPLGRREQIRNLTLQIEELLAQVDFLRSEIEVINERVRNEMSRRSARLVINADGAAAER